LAVLVQPILKYDLFPWLSWYSLSLNMIYFLGCLGTAYP
jgi:hypothetical protein